MSTMMNMTNINGAGTPAVVAASRVTVPQASGASIPLIENWADKSWPLNSRQASEVITEQVLQRQRSSTFFEMDAAEDLVGAEEEGDQDPVQNTSSLGDTMHGGGVTVTEQETITGSVQTSRMQESPSHNSSFGSTWGDLGLAQSPSWIEATMLSDDPNLIVSSTEMCPMACLPTPHLSRRYAHDPYCIYTGVKLFNGCTCPTCSVRPPTMG